MPEINILYLISYISWCKHGVNIGYNLLTYFGAYFDAKQSNYYLF